MQELHDLHMGRVHMYIPRPSISLLYTLNGDNIPPNLNKDPMPAFSPNRDHVPPFKGYKEGPGRLDPEERWCWKPFGMPAKPALTTRRRKGAKRITGWGWSLGAGKRYLGFLGF